MKHLVFDTETTALIENSVRALSKQPYIFEIAAVVWDDVENSEALFHWRVDPGVPISKIATKKTGVTDEMVKGRPSFRSIAPSVRETIEQSDCVVAHNLSFDRAMIDLEFKRLNEAQVNWPNKYACTVESTEHLLGYRLNLEHLHEHLFGEKFIGAHSAVADAQATLRVYRELLRRSEI